MSAESNKDKEIKRVPYGAISWYEKFLSLAQRIQINQIDKAYLQTHEIGIKNEPKVISGLKALNLIDENGNATPNLSKLHVVGNAYKDNLKEIVLEGYSLLLSKIDLDKVTREDIINTIITEYKASRRSAEEAAKIFVYLADESGITISENLASLRRKRKGRQRTTRPKTKTLKKTEKKSKDVMDEQLDVENMHKIVWGEDVILWLKKNDVNSAKKAMSLIKLYLDDIENTES